MKKNEKEIYKAVLRAKKSANPASGDIYWVCHGFYSNSDVIAWIFEPKKWIDKTARLAVILSGSIEHVDRQLTSRFALPATTDAIDEFSRASKLIRNHKYFEIFGSTVKGEPATIYLRKGGKWLKSNDFIYEKWFEN